MTFVIDRRVDEVLPSIPLTWYQADGITPEALASGWTASVRFAHVDRPTVELDAATITTGITLADTAPNFVISLPVDAWSDLVAAWGRTLPEHGTWFHVHPRLVLTATNKPYGWTGAGILARIRPAVT